MTQIQTRKFTQDALYNRVAVPDTIPFVEQWNEPYRIGLKNPAFRSVLVFELVDCITIGRESSASNVPHIDLQPYNALELGVSRRHAILKREVNHIFLIDNNSANGILLNHKVIRRETPYPVGNGDIIKLGLMCLQLIFLTNPFLAQ